MQRIWYNKNRIKIERIIKMTDINKIRDERLTEDEKMGIIADHLEEGGGGDVNVSMDENADRLVFSNAESKIEVLPLISAETGDISGLTIDWNGQELNFVSQ